MAAPVLAWIAVLTNSTQSGASAIIMRKMKSIHWITMNIYLNILFIILSGGYLGLSDTSVMESITTFDSVSWLLIIIISWSEISNKSFRLMAFRYQNPGKLAPYVYVYTLYGLAYDLFIFHVTFNGVTWFGIGLVLSAFSYHMYKMI